MLQTRRVRRWWGGSDDGYDQLWGCVETIREAGILKAWRNWLKIRVWFFHRINSSFPLIISWQTSHILLLVKDISCTSIFSCGKKYKFWWVQDLLLKILKQVITLRNITFVEKSELRLQISIYLPKLWRKNINFLKWQLKLIKNNSQTIHRLK